MSLRIYADDGHGGLKTLFVYDSNHPWPSRTYASVEAAMQEDAFAYNVKDMKGMVVEFDNSDNYVYVNPNTGQWKKVPTSKDLMSAPFFVRQFVARWLTRGPKQEKRKLRIIEMLSRDEDPRIRLDVASNSITPDEVLVRMVYDPSDKVRAQIASSRRIHELEFPYRYADIGEEQILLPGSGGNEPVWRKMAHDRSPEVRIALVQNECDAPTYILQILARDKDERVRDAVKKKHPDLKVP